MDLQPPRPAAPDEFDESRLWRAIERYQAGIVTDEEVTNVALEVLNPDNVDSVVTTLPESCRERLIGRIREHHEANEHRDAFREMFEMTSGGAFELGEVRMNRFATVVLPAIRAWVAPHPD
jgi:hypothetical protein